MLPGWDKLQDLRRGSSQPKPQEPVEAAREIRAVTTEKVIEANANRIVDVRQGIKEGKRMSLMGKLAHLTDDAQAFHKETEDDLDGVAAKIALGREKRKVAVAKHHAYYDTIIAGVDESTKVIDRLSNGPLHVDGD